MKKLLSFILAVVMVCSLFTAVPISADGARSWGVDNLNNKEGDLVIGFIGGSVTEGSGASPLAENRWSSLLVKDYFRKKYPNKNVIERNAAIGGTTSSSGHTRILSDLQCGGDKSPDVVFIDFAINDVSGSKDSSDINMESMVRQLLRLPKVPAIIFVYLPKTTSAADPTAHKDLAPIIEAQKKVADNYGILGIDINSYIWDGVAKGKWTWNSVSGSAVPFISGDTAHPKNAGYRIYADYIIEQLNKNERKAFSKLDVMTPPCTSYVYGELEEVPLSDPKVKLSPGWKFVAANPADANWSSSGDWIDKFFPDGYYCAEEGVGETVEFEFTGRGIGVQFVRTQHNATMKYEVYNKSGALVKSGNVSGTYYNQDSTRVIGIMFCTNLAYDTYKVKLTGVLNQSAINDHEKNPQTGGSGKRMPIGCFVVEKSMPEITPVAKDVKISGKSEIGATLTGSHTFTSHTNLYKEGASIKEWLVSDKENGTFTSLAEGSSLQLKAEHKGKYIRYAVTPIDNSEYGTAGKTVYSEPVFVTRPVGTISATPYEIKVDGAASDKLKAGKNTVSVNVTNEGSSDCTVFLTVALNETKAGFTKTNGVKVVSKLIPAGKTESVSAELTINAGTAFTEGKIMVIASDSLEPVKVIAEETAAIEYIGNEDNHTTVYKVNRFE